MPSLPQARDPLDEPLDPLSETALQWVVHLHSGMATPQDKAAYEAWRSSGPGPAAAASEAERLWQGLGAARGRRSLLPGLAALAVAGGAAALSVQGGLLPRPDRLWTDISTATERRHLTLPDGSELEVDAATRLDLAYDAERRGLVLHAGRIHVHVAPEPGRPFDVRAAGGTTRALGTQFAVSRDGDAVAVVVSEHAVRVSYAGRAVEVPVAQGVAYAPGTGLGEPQPVDLAAETAWRRGTLVFHGRRLAEVVGEIGRYRSGWILIPDAVLRERRITGVFPANDGDAFLAALPSLLPVRLRRFPLVTVIEPLS
ncbi:hypothetical protein RGI145_15335 [Roseomonas gilardii]|uniref:Fec operon regulator FecR n=1 Tax=Roseomonas gilardii TaxID=257708 RepID=A0A1L7AHQ0_9PROT|nr:FecR domain-containing protein [Roseomonas gilardii]APT58282.1 hypothetical protein RGI145_15335 [Roseomonas gilardii]